MSSASRGLAPREVLNALLMKMGRTGPRAEPRRGPQTGKSGDPLPRTPTVAPGLGFEAKPKVKCGAPRAPIACGLGRRVAVDWTWASPLPHAALESPWLGGHRNLHNYSSITCAIFLQFLSLPGTPLLFPI